jgi:D-sedoheptulose 7-phosphate isomerase
VWEIRPLCFALTLESIKSPMKASLLHGLEEHLALFHRLPDLSEPVNRAAERISAALAAGHKVMLCGNGGSAADSQHVAAELVGRFSTDRKALAAVSLTTDTSALTSIGNDSGFDEVFARQVAGIGRAGDCLIAISTSGNSRNVNRAAQVARAAGIHTIGLLGRDGGELLKLCDVPIVVPSMTTARIQEAHIFIGHTLCAMIEEALRLA